YFPVCHPEGSELASDEGSLAPAQGRMRSLRRDVAESGSRRPFGMTNRKVHGPSLGMTVMRTRSNPVGFRILLASDFYAPFIGGAERQVQYLATEMAQRGHQTSVATVWHEGLPEHEE